MQDSRVLASSCASASGGEGLLRRRRLPDVRVARLRSCDAACYAGVVEPYGTTAEYDGHKDSGVVRTAA